MSKIVTIPTDGMNPFVVMHNGEEYVYPPGATLEVPDGVALEIEEYKRWHKKFYGDNEPPFGAGGGSANIDVTAEVGQTIVVEEVDASGKPTKWKAAEYQPRTHWSEEGLEVIVPELTFTPVFNESMGVYQHPLAPFELVEGKTYAVIFDGIEYSCIAKHATLDSLDGIFIGNGVLAGENTGEPFVIAVGDLMWTDKFLMRIYMVASFDSNEHTIRVIEDKIVPHKIPEEYVTPSVFNVLVGVRDDSTFDLALLTPWEHIIEAVKSGKVIFMRIAGDDYEYDSIGNLFTYYQAANYICADAKVGTNSLDCSLKFVLTANSNGTVSYLTIARDKNGVTTVSLFGD